MLAFLARLFLLRRLFGGGSSRHRRRGSRGRRSGGSFGMYGPFPRYTRQTRRGSRVSVGGCCLPIPLALSALVVSALRLFAARR